MGHIIRRSLKASTRENKEMTCTGRSVHQLTAVPKNWQDFMLVDDNNLFHIFPTAVFLGHKICQLRNSYHRWRSGVAS